MAHASPVPIQTVDGLDGATESAPIAWTGRLSEIGRNVAPLSTDFHTPPDAAPRYQTRGLPGTPLIAEMRPPSAGPIIWNRNGSGWGGGEGAAFLAWYALVRTARRRQRARSSRSCRGCGAYSGCSEGSSRVMKMPNPRSARYARGGAWPCDRFPHRPMMAQTAPRRQIRGPGVKCKAT